MPLFSAPQVRTYFDSIPIADDYGAMQNEQMPEPTAEALQRQFQSVRLVPGDPSVQHVGGFTVPDVPYSVGWYFPQMNPSPQMLLNQQYSAPNILTIPPSWSPQVQQAAQVQPQIAYTGVRLALRAPGINEGM